MDNQEFLEVITCSFKTFLMTGSRSNEKLKILHKAIATDIIHRLGGEYSVKALGINDGREEIIKGKYIDKKVDITIMKKGRPVAGIGVKFVMQNYSQNSNNYFENMLGETANIRCSNTPYFQIFIIPDKLPYYKNNGELQKWETFTEHNSSKYMVLSRDDVQTSIHTPTKTLLYVIHLPEIGRAVSNRSEYNTYYSNLDDMMVCESEEVYGDFSNAVIYNDYENFAKKVVAYINYL